MTTEEGEQVFLDGEVMNESWILSEEKMSQEDAYPECTVHCDQLC